VSIHDQSIHWGFTTYLFKKSKIRYMVLNCRNISIVSLKHFQCSYHLLFFWNIMTTLPVLFSPVLSHMVIIVSFALTDSHLLPEISNLKQLYKWWCQRGLCLCKVEGIGQWVVSPLADTVYSVLRFTRKQILTHQG
jgi:hypothetical protein